MQNAIGNALQNALVNATEPDTRHQTPEPITTTLGRLVPTHCPALTTDRARELAAKTIHILGTQPHALTRGDHHDYARRLASDPRHREKETA